MLIILLLLHIQSQISLQLEAQFFRPDPNRTNNTFGAESHLKRISVILEL